MKSIIAKALRVASFVPMMALLVSAVVPMPVFAATCDGTTGGITQGASCAKGTGQATQLFGDGSVFQSISNMLLFLVGSISVIMLIIGGIRYVISGGDQSAVIIGIVVAFLAFAAVQYVTNSLSTAK
jgi:hypothetical protein